MPPEPLPWERRDSIFREKKHERGSSFGDAVANGGGSSVSRWRDPYHSRDGVSSSARRPQSNNQRHHGLSDEDPCTRSEDNGFRSYHSGRYGGGGYRGNTGREGGGFFRRSAWDSADIPKQNHDSVASPVPAAESSPLPSNQGLSGNEDGVDRGIKASHREDRDPDHSLGSLSWKPLKWNRSGSFSSSSKAPKLESEERKLEVALSPGKETPIESPITSPLSPEEGISRKKQRLGWGQGLAKYERAKTEAFDDVGARLTSNCDDASPRVPAPVGSTSPATPMSLTCSSSHGGDDKIFSEVANSDVTLNARLISGDEFRHLLEELSIIPECLDLYSPNSSFSLFPCSLLPEETSNDDFSWVRQSTMGKLLSVKNQVLKQLEKTEADIDLFENELKKLKSDNHGQVLSTLNDNCREPTKISPGVMQSSEDKSVDVAKVVGSPVHSGFRETILEEKGPTDAEPVKRQDAVDVGKSESLQIVPVVDFAEEFHRITTSIIASNQEDAKKASLSLDSRSSVDPLPALQKSVSQDNFSDQEREQLIRKKIGVRKCNLKIKEKVLALKYKALLHLWKEDLQLNHFKKQRQKAHRKMEISRSSQHVVQKCRSLLRAQNHPSGPAPEILEFAGKLLADSQARIHRNFLRMPALILDERERIQSRFITTNSLIEDPSLIEKERSLINPWAPEERKIFIEMLALYGKDFSKIATFLDHKTTADCVEFYYKHHKSEDFEKVKKSLRQMKSSAGARGFLVTAPSTKNWKREVTPAKEEETCAADVLVGIMAVERRLPSELSETAEDSSSEDSGGGHDDGFRTGDWTDEEKSRFISALVSHGRDFADVARRVGSRSAEQCKVFFSKARKSLDLDGIVGRVSVSEETSATCQASERRPVEGGSEESPDSEAKQQPTGSSVKLFGRILSHPQPQCASRAGVLSREEEETLRSGVDR